MSAAQRRKGERSIAAKVPDNLALSAADEAALDKAWSQITEEDVAASERDLDADFHPEHWPEEVKRLAAKQARQQQRTKKGRE